MSKVNKIRCNERVFGDNHPFRGGQCSRYDWKDGKCKQHHPETKKARSEAQDAKWKAARDERERNSPQRKIRRMKLALQKIANRECKVHCEKDPDDNCITMGYEELKWCNVCVAKDALKFQCTDCGNWFDRDKHGEFTDSIGDGPHCEDCNEMLNDLRA